MSLLTTWHQALAYAVSGARLPELGEQVSPDLGALADVLVERAAGGRITLVTQGGAAFPVPEDLLHGIGPAQYWAALAQLRNALVSRTGLPQEASVVSDRPLDPDERRLLADRPPHHRD